MKSDTQVERFLTQQLALSAYLDALLYEAPVPPPAEQDGQGVHEQAAVAAESASVREPLPEQSLAAAEQSEQAAGGEPEWAQGRFQTLLFEVAGLTLAVPLAKLKGVIPNEAGLTPMPGHSQLFLGVTPYQGMQSKVVDTARFVLPQDRVAQLDEDATERTGHLVMIDDGRWALACNTIGDVVELSSRDVKWRTGSGKRRWLAGTVIERMCALLDVDELVQLLVDGMAR